MRQAVSEVSEESNFKIWEPRTWQRRSRLMLIASVCVAAATALSLAPRMPIGPAYHVFADTRTMWGIPNALDVLSNLPFFFVGMWGLLWLMRDAGRAGFLDRRERIPYLVFFAGVMFTGVGSFWYHLAPCNQRLPWDLVPMTCAFVALVVAAYMERVNVRAGYAALAPLLLVGASTVFYWYFTNATGHGDYKYYLFLQFFSPVVLTLLIALFPPRYTGFRFLAIAFLFYVLAKFFENYDFPIYRDLHGTVSGHTLKHLIAGVACFWVLLMLKRRQPIVQGQTGGSRAANLVESDKSVANI